jgi:hypothetical protein
LKDRAIILKNIPTVDIVDKNILIKKIFLLEYNTSDKICEKNECIQMYAIIEENAIKAPM